MPSPQKHVDTDYSIGSTPFYETIIGFSDTSSELYDNSMQDDEEVYGPHVFLLYIAFFF